MAWTTPRTWTPGELVTALMMNQHVRDQLNVLKTSIANDGSLAPAADIACAASLSIRQNTSDGADNQSLGLSGGGAAAFASATRGAVIMITGNEEASRPGRVTIIPGNVAGGRFQVTDGAFAFDALSILGSDGSTVFTSAATDGFKATAVFGSTTGSAANVFVASDGALRRSTSSERYKTDIRISDVGLSAILKLRPITFISKDDPESGVHFGFTAEEVAAVIPSLVKHDKVDDQWVPGWIEYDYLTAPIVKAIQELHARVVALEARR